jgi:DNA invertase Pin-like site-specific DNA recombinase
MKVAIYARVSTDDKEQNPERQKLACEKYAELHNHDVIAYFEDYISGDTNPFEREGFKNILLKKPQGILFFEISRFSREHPSKVMRRLQELKDKSIKSISITEQAFNMEGEMSDLIQYILTWFNNYYLSNLKKNIKSGLDRAVKNGKTLGRPKAKVNLYEVAREFGVAGASISSVSKKLGIPRTNIYRHYQECVQKGLLKKP